MTPTAAKQDNGTGAQPVGAEAGASVPEGRNKSLNIHERKLAVMARVGEIHHDKTHPAHKYTYNSIDNISNAIRALFIEYGIAYEPSCSDGQMIVKLVNVDTPTDTSTTTWPLVPDDKGFAYSTKFPLVRTFLIADSADDDPDKSGEADESQMASNSGRAASTPRPSSGATRPAAAQGRTTGTGAQPLGPCPECAAEGITAASGKPAAYWPPRKPGQLPQCNGYSSPGKAGGVYLNHQLRPAAEDVPDQVPMEVYGDDIPF